LKRSLHKRMMSSGFPGTGLALLCLFLYCFFPLAAQQTYSFTNCSATGSVGPTQLQVTTAYALTNLSLVTTTSPTSGIQTFTAPFTGPYRIEAYGAQGGFGAGNPGGAGAQMVGEFTLTAGTVLYVLVGQMGGSQVLVQANSSGAGGGGSFVTYTNNIPLVVAGGGGGGGLGQAGLSGTTSLNGTQSLGTSGFGGINGGGGGAGLGGTAGTNLLAGGSGTSCSYGSGGGGFYTPGGNNCFGNPTWATGGSSYLSGGFGGPAQTAFAGVSGGFGGGGGTGHRASGGGGWSGGGGDGNLNNNLGLSGGGGGSYNIGTNQNNISGANTGHGRVIITELCYITAVGPSPICIGQSATLTTNAIGNYSWTPSGSTSSFAVVSPTVTTTYTVVGQSTMNCMSYNLVTVSVTPQLSLTIGASSPTACAGSTIALTANGSGGIPAYTYTWSGGPASSNYNISQPAGNYTHSVTVRDANNCALSGTISAGFIANPVLSTSNFPLCMGSAANLTVSGASTYTWNPGNSPGANFSPSPTVATVYTVTGTALTGCTASATAPVTILPVPVLSFQTASITCSSLGSATVTASGGTGPYTYTWNPSAQTASVANSLNPGSYTLTVRDIGTGCVSTATTVFTSLIPLTGNLNNTPGLTCYGVNTGTANYTNLAGGSPMQNYLWSNGASSFNTSNPTGLGAGNWTATVTDALTGCVLSNTFTITQPPALAMNMSSSSPTACAGTTIVLNGTVSGGTAPYTISWVGGPVGSNYTVNEPLAGSYTYSLNVNDANGCFLSTPIAATFVPNPVLSLSNVSICPQAMGMLSASGANTYTWSNTTFGSALFASPLVNTQYTVVGTAQACTTAATASIIVMPAPVALPSSNSPLCNGDALQLMANNGAAYNWTGPGGFAATAQSSTITPVGISHAGVYNVTLTAANTCTAAASLTVVVNPTPTVSAAGSTVCTSQVLLLNSSSVPGASYQWSGPAGYASAQQNPVIASPGLNASGTYTVKATSVDGCTNIAITPASVVSPPSLAVTLSSNSLCAQGLNGSPNNITINVSGANSYTIAPPVNVSNSNFNGPSSSMSVLPPYTPGPVVVTVAGSNGICSSITTANFLVVPNPVISVSAPTVALCAGQQYSFSAQGAASYVWSPAGPGLIVYNGGSLAVASPSASALFSVYGSSLGCNSSTQSTSVTVNAIPSTSVALDHVQACLGQPVKLVAGGSSASYNWSPALGLNATSGSSVTATLFGNQQYTVTGSSNGCISKAVITVNVLGLPVVQISNLKPVVCIYDTIALSGSGGNSYHWTGPYGFDMDGKSIFFTAANLARSGTYTLTATDLNGCSNSTVTSITIYEMPQVNLDGGTIGCAPFCPVLKLNRASSSSSSLIVTGWETTKQNLQTSHFTTCLDVAGGHTLTAWFKDSYTGCRNTQTFAITVLARPEADFTWEPEIPVEKVDEIRFINTSRGTGQQRWDWYFADNSHASARENPVTNFDYAGNYAVALVVWDKNQCADTIVKSITVAPDFNVYIPNSFTPNGDGLNDTFYPVARNHSGSYSLQVFNRWGQMVFTTTHISDGWDGNFLNNPCKAETYTYLLKLTAMDGQWKEFKGRVTLVR
jgi:gliding motility-associated-like protein